VGVAVVIMRAAPDAPATAEFTPIPVQMVELPPPPPPPPPPEPEKPPDAPAPPKVAPPKPVPEKKPPPRIKARVAKAPAPDVIPIPAGKETVLAPAAEVSESELAGATTAESGGAGRGCNMAGWLQKKLRGDWRVKAALADAHSGRALRVWNGDWVRHPGQEGDGLAQVREAIMWEVAFAPQACRAERVRGLVLLSLSDQPGGPRVVLGANDWAWSDLLFIKRGRAGG
jgi:hypothetical protein